jgi:hypothetical protein
MFPDSNYQPAGASQLPVVPLVSFSRPSQLLCPPIGVRLREARVVLAAMPLASVYEDGDLCSREHNVSLTTKAGKWPGTSPVTKSPTVQLLA